MERSLGLLLVLLTLAIIHIVQAQDQQGFISLDCGLPANETSPYNETQTGLLFFSDSTFIQSGKTGRIQANQESEFLKPYTTLRYFPEGIRNCYNLSVFKERKYLITAYFLYGNYDGRNTAPVFDLYLGPNLWANVDLQDVNGTQEEILHIPTSNSLQICLVDTGMTTPLISSLELRPMRTGTYTTVSGSLKTSFRIYFNKSGSRLLRYSKDVYDRSWIRRFMDEWTQISTALEVRNDNIFEPPKDAMKNAVTPTNASVPLTVKWFSKKFDDQYYFYAHFAEIEDLQANDTREFNFLLNGQLLLGPVVPDKLGATSFQSPSPQTCGWECNFQLIRTERSTLPPLLNAFEVYTIIQFPQSETDQNDVVAMNNISASYGLGRINWQGDPCFPQQLRWDALDCSNTNISTPPRITSLDLSSSRLNGTIAAAIQSLAQLETLDLSYNNLTGGVPEFLGKMKSLSVINLSGNNLNGSIPQALQKKRLKLYLEGNPSLIKPPKKKFHVAIVTSVALVTIIVVLFLVFRKKMSTIVEGLLPPTTSTVDVTFSNKKGKRFTYSEVVQMTKNFQRVLGKGGFGMVYHGTANGSHQVAVKEFKAEVDLLLRVHHINLVSLVGYCYEGDHFCQEKEVSPSSTGVFDCE